MPNPFTSPFSITIILSASCTEEILCAIMNLVVPAIASFRDYLILASVAVSTADVESSKIRILGFLSKALAIQILCF